LLGFAISVSQKIQTVLARAEGTFQGVLATESETIQAFKCDGYLYWMLVPDVHCALSFIGGIFRGRCLVDKYLVDITILPEKSFRR
jgi:hypothetical protein